MAWLYVPGLERSSSESEWPWTSDIELSVMSSGAPTPRACSWRGWKTRPWIALLSGTISRPSMARHGVVSWTSSLRVYRVSPTASRGSSAGTKTSERSGPTSSASSMKSIRPSSSLRTSRSSRSTSSPSGSDFETWVSSGLRRCFRPPRNTGRPISETASTQWLPTPTAQHSGSNRGGRAGRVGEFRPSLESLAKSLPTPTSRDWKDGDCRDADVPTNALLGRWVARLPTTTTSDAKASGAAGYSTQSGRHSGTTLTDIVAGAASTGRTGILNPRLSEWMQGLPSGWTSCMPLATSELRRWRMQAHFSRFWRI